MVSGSRDNLLAVAKSETNPELKVQAIQLLGNVGGSADLAQLYANESSARSEARDYQRAVRFRQFRQAVRPGEERKGRRACAISPSTSSA